MRMWSKFHKILKKWSKIQKVESGEPVNEISYQLNVNDYSSYLTFQKAQTVSVKRQKAVVRWLVCIIAVSYTHLDVYKRQVPDHRTALFGEEEQ